MSSAGLRRAVAESSADGRHPGPDRPPTAPRAPELGILPADPLRPARAARRVSPPRPLRRVRPEPGDDHRDECEGRSRALRGRRTPADDQADTKGIPVMDIVLRGVFIFFVLYLLMRVIGRRELSSLEPFDLILLVVLGDAVQQGLTQDDYSLTGALLAIGTIAMLQLGVSYANFRFPRLRPFLDGEPIVVVRDGKPIERNLRRERVTLDDLTSAMRQQNIAQIDDVQWAVMETSGAISFIKKSDS